MDRWIIKNIMDTTGDVQVTPAHNQDSLMSADLFDGVS